MSTPPAPHGRGSHLRPANRFTGISHEIDLDALDALDEDERLALTNPATRYLVDSAVTVVSENNSPDIPFRYSLNPYRGCLHGCSYCYARPTHEYLGLNAGLDFETVIFVKEKAPELFRAFLARPSWQPEVIALSGVTDCYQPCERSYRLTRGCLEVARTARQPISLITKNALILGDGEIIQELATHNLVHVSISVTTLDAELARALEPRTSTPVARLRAIRELSSAGVPVRVLVAPIIPGLNDHEIPAILEAAREAGAQSAYYQMLRLPGAVVPVFQEWLQRARPDAVERVEGRIRQMRGGKLNDPRFGKRMKGEGEMAEQIGNLFRLFARKVGLDAPLPEYDTTRFRPPGKDGQLWLF